MRFSPPSSDPEPQPVSQAVPTRPLDSMTQGQGRGLVLSSWKHYSSKATLTQAHRSHTPAGPQTSHGPPEVPIFSSRL